MSIFDKVGKRKVCATAPQTSYSQPFESLCNFFPSSINQPELYRSLREAIPIIDTAIYKLVRLVGGFSVKSANGKNQQELDNFVRNISVNGTGNGLQQFIDIYFEELLTFGTSAGEIITDCDGINSLYNVPIRNICLKRNPKNFNEILICRPDSTNTPVKFQELVMYSALNPEAGSITGNSILKGLPFVASILVKIYESIGQNWERAGNLRYAVTYRV